MAIESLRHAVQIAGGQTALARALSTPERRLIQANVQKWLNSPNPEKMPPAEFCPAIERATGVTCESLRPDVDWAYIRKCDCRSNAA
jgi:DNA-binding transcriptional regulator YdaS (Cro superfamily)